MPNVFSYSVSSISSVAPTVSQIMLRPKRSPALSYQAGQYIEVMHLDGALSPLSIACAPNPSKGLEFHLFHAEENYKANELLRLAQEEKKWTLKGPKGLCTANRLHPKKPIIFLARGTGFAPIKAVIEALISRHAILPMHFYWSVKTQQDLYLLSLLEKWEQVLPGFTFIPVLTQETGSHVLPQVILRDHPDLSAYQVYASGPQPLITTAFSDFVEKGLHSEAFYSDLTP